MEFPRNMYTSECFRLGQKTSCGFGAWNSSCLYLGKESTGSNCPKKKSLLRNFRAPQMLLLHPQTQQAQGRRGLGKEQLEFFA